LLDSLLQEKMFGTLLSSLSLALLVGFTMGEDDYEDGDARLGYISVASDGSTSITFNATSIQNAVILSLFVLVLGALVLPLFGLSLGSLFGSDDAGSGTGYGSQYGYTEQGYDGYDAPASSYQSFSKRSVEMLGPVLDALTSAKDKYDN